MIWYHTTSDEAFKVLVPHTHPHTHTSTRPLCLAEVVVVVALASRPPTNQHPGRWHICLFSMDLFRLPHGGTPTPQALTVFPPVCPCVRRGSKTRSTIQFHHDHHRPPPPRPLTTTATTTTITANVATPSPLPTPTPLPYPRVNARPLAHIL